MPIMLFLILILIFVILLVVVTNIVIVPQSMVYVRVSLLICLHQRIGRHSIYRKRLLRSCFFRRSNRKAECQRQKQCCTACYLPNNCFHDTQPPVSIMY